jgi:Protein of unknown function VcgC/VcgE (DUF2780)
MRIRIPITSITLCLCAGIALASGNLWAQTPGADNPSPELVGKLTKELSITPKQATGGAGALFGLAKTRLKPDEFSQVAKAVPGMDGLLKAAPKAEKKNSGSSALGSLGSVGSVLPGGTGGLGGLASVAGPFKSLGLSPDMAGKFVPVLTQFVDTKGGSSVSKLLAGALK